MENKDTEHIVSGSLGHEGHKNTNDGIDECKYFSVLHPHNNYLVHGKYNVY